MGEALYVYHHFYPLYYGANCSVFTLLQFCTKIRTVITKRSMQLSIDMPHVGLQNVQ